MHEHVCAHTCHTCAHTHTPILMEEKQTIKNSIIYKVSDR